MGNCSCCDTDRAELLAANLDIKLNDKVPVSTFMTSSQTTDRTDTQAVTRPSIYVDTEYLDKDCKYNKLSETDRIPSIAHITYMNYHSPRLDTIGSEYATYDLSKPGPFETHWFSNQPAPTSPTRKTYRKSILNRSSTFTQTPSSDDCT